MKYLHLALRTLLLGFTPTAAFLGVAWAISARFPAEKPSIYLVLAVPAALSAFIGALLLSEPRVPKRVAWIAQIVSNPGLVTVAMGAGLVFTGAVAWFWLFGIALLGGVVLMQIHELLMFGASYFVVSAATGLLVRQLGVATARQVPK